MDPFSAFAVVTALATTIEVNNHVDHVVHYSETVISSSGPLSPVELDILQMRINAELDAEKAKKSLHNLKIKGYNDRIKAAAAKEKQLNQIFDALQ